MNKRENGENDILSNSKESTDAKGVISKNRKWISRVCLLILIITMLSLIGACIYLVTKLSTKKVTRDFRLPKSIVPNHYTLEIQPFLSEDQFTFKGSVEINFVCKRRTDVVILHAKNLSIDHRTVRIWNKKGKDVEIMKIDYDPDVDLLILNLMDELPLNNYVLFMNFQGKLSQSLNGFYVYPYEDEDNNTYYAAATQFEPIHAREAFPCFDEPQLKATFDITVVRWRNMTALSNMPKVETESRGRYWEADIFETSLKMSTYLVAFVVGKFKSKQGEGKITLWASPKKIEYVDFALEVAEMTLPFFETLLGVPYDAPKLDIVSVEEFKTGGMENWGLIICREGILYNEEKDYISHKEEVARIIIHEIAHQWFGNLVTMKWWDDLWLNEGITKYMEEIAFDALREFLNVTNNTITSFSYENYLFIRTPVTKKIKSLTDINNAFDSSTYYMGALVMRLAYYLFGEETFWKGITNYLKENAYKSVEESTLWEYFTNAQQPIERSRLNISKILTSWTHLNGYPILTVERDYDKHSANLTQIGYNADEFPEIKNDSWPIPISYTTSRDRDWRPIIKTWLNNKTATIANISRNRDDWLIVNAENIAYCLVNYDETNWNLLAKQLRYDHLVIPAKYRYKILNDASILHRVNHTALVTLLDLYLYCPFEEELAVLLNSGFFVTLMELSDLLQLTPDEFTWDNYIIYLFEPIYKKLDWNYGERDEDTHHRHFRFISIFMLCTRKYMPCVNTAIAKFKIWKQPNNDTDVPDEIKIVAMCIGIEYGTADEWNDIFNEYLETENRMMISALTCSRNRTLINKLLQQLLIKPKVKHFGIIIHDILRNPHMWLEIFHFFNIHFKELASDDKKFDDIVFNFEVLESTPVKFNQVIATGKQYMKVLSKAKADKYKKLLQVDEEMKKQMEWEKISIKKWLNEKPWKKVRRT